MKVRFRAANAQGHHLHVVAEVLADWHWGYDGKPTETMPMQVYGLHEIRLTQSGEGWRVTLDRNLASTPKTRVTVDSLDFQPAPWAGALQREVITIHGVPATLEHGFTTTGV